MESKPERLLKIEGEIEELMLPLLGPMRKSKSIDGAAVNRLLPLLVELKSLMSGEKVIGRKLAGMLFDLFISVLAEAGHAKNPQPLQNLAWEIAEHLGGIFWDPPWKGIFPNPC